MEFTFKQILCQSIIRLIVTKVYNILKIKCIHYGDNKGNHRKDT